MKSRYWIATCALLLATGANAQILNPGFDTWTAGDPDDWAVNNAAGVTTPITKDSLNQRSGTAALRGTVVTFPPPLETMPFPPVVLGVFPSTTRPASLTGYIRCGMVAGDSVGISVVISRADSGIGAGGILLGGTQTGYQLFTIPIMYIASGDPTDAAISVSIYNSNATNVGSYFLLDDLAFSGVNDVAGNPATPGEFALEQNFPNPFNPATTISYTLPVPSDVRLTVYDALGREVALLVEGEEAAGSHRVQFTPAGLASGVYFARLQAGNTIRNMKMSYIR